MKICPTCQQQYPNGFQYCPTDTDVLITAEEYLRRTRPLTPPPVAPAAAAPEAASAASSRAAPRDSPRTAS